MLEFVLAAVLAPPTDAQVRAAVPPRAQSVIDVCASKELVGVAVSGGAVVCRWRCRVTDVPTVRTCLRYVRAVDVETGSDGRSPRPVPRG